MTQAVTTATLTTKTYDFDKAFGPVKTRIQDLAELATMSGEIDIQCEHQDREFVHIRGKASRWLDGTINWTRNAGYHHPAKSQQYKTPAMANDQMQAAFNSHISLPETWQTLQNDIERDPYRAFRDISGTIDLGRVPQRFHAFETCSACRGYGEHKCCLMGGNTCGGCYGKKQVASHVSNGNYIWLNCTWCNGSGWQICRRCNGTTKYDCNACETTGGFTYAYTASVTGHWESTLTPVHEKTATDAANFIAAGRVEVLKNSFIQTPKWTLAGNRMQTEILFYVPRLETRYEYNHLGQAHAFKTTCLGINLKPMPMPRFLDAMIEPYIHRIERSAGIQAFAVARECTFTDVVGQGVTDKTVATDVITATYDNAVSASNVHRIENALRREAKRLTTKPAARGWIDTQLAILLIWVVTAVALGDVIRDLIVRQPIQNAQMSLAATGLMLIALAIGLGHLWTAKRMRKTLSTVLKRPIAKAPGQGWRGFAGASLATLLVGFAVTAYLPGAKTGAGYSVATNGSRR